MKVDGKLFTIFIMVVALIPGAYATTVSTGSGTSISGTGSAQGNFATNGVQTTGFAAANGPSVNADHWVQDSTGKRVEVDVNVPSADKVNWRFSLSPGNKYDHKTLSAPQSSLTAQEWLDVTNAKTTIQADAIASNGEGDQAQVGINMGPGSLLGYQNSATATTTDATAIQNAPSASGKKFGFSETSQATNRNGLVASVSVGVDKGSIDIKQGATASEFTANAWQGINSADGKNIELNAVTSDGMNGESDSSVTIDRGSLVNYNSYAQASQENGYIDLYAMHGAFNLVDKKVNPCGSISGDIIHSLGHTTSQTGSKANYEVTIQGKDKKPAVEGRFDWGTETTSNGWVIAVPLESPLVWRGIPGELTLSASKISSSSEADDEGGNKISEDTQDAKWVSAQFEVKDIKNWPEYQWPGGYGFAKSSESGVNPNP